ncbi:MAG: MBL fold metallo-hydrolase [Candidatus Lokiarchaeota archaeon]|nr:MBL fold metallo-hydrolase [Candidatus Lokiarchaeota archaeon]
MTYIRESREISDNSYLIDAESFGIKKQNAVYFIQGSEKNVLIDTGTRSDARKIKKYIIEEIGAKKIDFIIITHGHMDHSGGLPNFLKKFGSIKVFISEKSVPLIKTTKEYIQKKGLDSYVETVKEGDKLIIGDKRELKIMDTPGHSPDHISVLDSKTKYIYVGDSAGAYHIGKRFCRPTAYAPDFQYFAYLNTLKRFINLDMNGVGIASFGFVKGEDSKIILKFGLETFKDWYDTIKECYNEGLEIDDIFIKILNKFGKSPGEKKENRPIKWIKRFLMASIQGFIDSIKREKTNQSENLKMID